MKRFVFGVVLLLGSLIPGGLGMAQEQGGSIIVTYKDDISTLEPGDRLRLAELFRLSRRCSAG